MVIEFGLIAAFYWVKPNEGYLLRSGLFTPDSCLPNNIITGDETWIYFFTVSSKESNKVWLEKGENRPQIVRTAKNSKKRMFVFFYTVTVNGELYRKQICWKKG